MNKSFRSDVRCTFRMAFTQILPLLVVLVLMGVSAVADATTALLLTREQLIQRSTFVARVTVGAAVATVSDDGASIVTRTELDVTKLLKGTAKSKVVVEQIGGTYQGKSQRVLGDGKLVRGQDAIVFLSAGEQGRFYLTALAMSVYNVDPNGLAKRQLDGIHFVKRSGGQIVPIPAPVEQPEPVESLMTDIVRIAGGK